MPKSRFPVVYRKSRSAATSVAPTNVRDLGGIPVAGGVVRPGFAIRADDLSTVTEEIAADMVADGLVTIIDLRSTEEAAFTGRGPFVNHPVTYHHISFMSSLGSAMRDPELWKNQQDFGTSYVSLFENAAAAIVKALAIIAYSNGTVAFHCSAGQDRTGVLAAAILLALGADDDTIVADYGRTGDNQQALHARLRPVMGELMAQFGIDLNEHAQAAVRSQFSSRAMRDCLAMMHERCGDPLATLRSAGLTDDLVAALRARAVA